MAPFTISPHDLHRAAPYKQSKMSLKSSSNPSGTHQDLPLSPYRRTSVFSMLLKIRLHLWRAIQRIVNYFMSVTRLFSSNMFFFICVGKNTAMTGELKKGVVEAQERSGWELMSGAVNSDEEMKDTEMMELEDELSKPAERQESSVNNSDEEEEEEEEEEDEEQLSEWESEEDTDDGTDEEDDDENKEQPPQNEELESECDDDVDSDWSDDDDDDDGDSEASAESLELWESFFKSSDPYNPLSVFSCTGSRTNTTSTNKNLSSQLKQTEPTPTTKTDEHYTKPSTKEGGKKVSFSDKVSVRPLVAWSFASRAARDGSCWMQMARDRDRFRRRVESIETVISTCVTPEHRAGVWERLQRETSS